MCPPRTSSWETVDKHDSQFWTPASCCSWCSPTCDGTQWRGEGEREGGVGEREGAEFRGEGEREGGGKGEGGS